MSRPRYSILPAQNEQGVWVYLFRDNDVRNPKGGKLDYGVACHYDGEKRNFTKTLDAVEAIDQLMQRLDAGDWTKEREGGTGLAGASILTKAMVEFTGTSPQQVRDYLSKLDNKTKVALRNSPELGPIVKRLEDEAKARAEARGKAAPVIDVAAVLAGLTKPTATSAFDVAPV